MPESRLTLEHEIRYAKRVLSSFVNEHERAAGAVQMRQRLHERMPGAELRLLLHHDEIGGGHRFRDLLAAVRNRLRKMGVPKRSMTRISRLADQSSTAPAAASKMSVAGT